MLADSKAFSGFSVSNPQAARQFYEDVLGLRTEELEGGMFNLLLSGGQHTLVYPSPTHQPASYTVLNFPVGDIDSTVAELTERGVAFEKYEGSPMETDPSGVFRKGGPLIAWFKDPSGNVMSIIERTESAGEPS
jgi:catechol 2,3-dioxygenase-like lactoylglutathione lyase family enzyme